VAQTPVAAGLAWYIAHTLLGHRARAGAVRRPPGRQHRAAALVSAVAGPPGRGPGRTLYLLAASVLCLARARRDEDPHARLIAGLVETCASDALRGAGREPGDG
jgi:hypothetical protein